MQQKQGEYQGQNEHDGTSRIRELAVTCYGGRVGEGRKKRGSRELLKKRRGTNASLYLAELRAGRFGRLRRRSPAATLDLVIHRYGSHPG